MTYSAKCHCGKIAFDVEGEIDSLMECNCSICSKKGYLLWFVSMSQVSFHTPREAMSTYNFNKHVIAHKFCASCGCAPISTGTDANGDETAAINARCLENVDLAKFVIQQYDGRSVGN